MGCSMRKPQDLGTARSAIEFNARLPRWRGDRALNKNTRGSARVFDISQIFLRYRIKLNRPGRQI